MKVTLFLLSPAELVYDDDAPGASDSPEHEVQGLGPGLRGLQPCGEAGDDGVGQHHLHTTQHKGGNITSQLDNITDSPL